MAKLNKKLNLLLKGVTENATLYSTLTEVQNQGLPLKVDGVQCYAKLGATTDELATRGRAKNTTGTYAILSTAQIPYGVAEYTTPGTYTFTAPTGCSTVKVIASGAGGGSGKNDGYGRGDTLIKGNPGGHGASCIRTLNVLPLTTYTIIIGAGGAGGTSSTGVGSAGGTTSFGSLLTLGGGGGGGCGNNQYNGTSPAPQETYFGGYGSGGAVASGDRVPGLSGAGGYMKIEWGGGI